MHRRPAACFLAALLCAGGAAATPSAAPRSRSLITEFGPLGLRTQGTLRELFLDMTGSDARPVDRLQLDLRWAGSNTWNEPTQFIRHGQTADLTLDEQADCLTARVQIPWSAFAGPAARGINTAVEAKATLHWGGWSDGAIEGWHSLIGAFNFNRSTAPRNRLLVHFADANGTTALDLRSNTLGFGDVALRTQVPLWEGGASLSGARRSRTGLAARFDLKLPTGSLSAATGSGGFDEGVGLQLSTELTPWLSLHAMAFLAHYDGLSSPILLQPRPWHSGAEASLEAAVGEVHLFFEDRVLSPLFADGWHWNPDGDANNYLSSAVAAHLRPHNQMTWGLRYWRTELWLSEDFTPGPNPQSGIPYWYESNSPDVTIGLNVHVDL